MIDQTLLQEEIAAVLAGTLHVDVPSAATDLLAGGLLDSLGIVELLAEVETRCGVRIPMERLELEDVRSVNAIAAFVTRLRNGG